MWIGRLAVWLGALVFGAMPFFLGVWTTPGSIFLAIDANQALHAYRDLVFGVMTIFGLCMLDGSEVLIKESAGSMLRSATVAIVLFSALAAVACVSWANSPAPSKEDIVVLLYSCALAVIVSLVQRVCLIYADGSDE